MQCNHTGLTSLGVRNMRFGGTCVDVSQGYGSKGLGPVPESRRSGPTPFVVRWADYESDRPARHVHAFLEGRVECGFLRPSWAWSETSARSERLRILYAHSFYRIPGGEDRHVRDQIDLVSGAHDVELISEANIDLSESPATAARMLYSRAKKRDVGRIIDRFAPDVVHVHNTYPSLGPAVVLAANERGIPIVMTVHNFRLRCPNGFMFTEGALCHRCESGVYINALVHQCFPTKKQAGAYATVLWAHRFVMRLEERIARFIVPSDFMRKRLLRWGIGEDRVRVIRHFVASAGSRSHPSIGSYGAFVGRLSPEKGLDVLLAALARAGDPPFLIVGDGPQRAALEDLAAQAWARQHEVPRLAVARASRRPGGRCTLRGDPVRLGRDSQPGRSRGAFGCPSTPRFAIAEHCPSSWPAAPALCADLGMRSILLRRSHA